MPRFGGVLVCQVVPPSLVTYRFWGPSPVDVLPTTQPKSASSRPAAATTTGRPAHVGKGVGIAVGRGVGLATATGEAVDGAAETVALSATAGPGLCEGLQTRLTASSAAMPAAIDKQPSDVRAVIRTGIGGPAVDQILVDGEVVLPADFPADRPGVLLRGIHIGKQCRQGLFA